MNEQGRLSHSHMCGLVFSLAEVALSASWKTSAITVLGVGRPGAPAPEQGRKEREAQGLAPPSGPAQYLAPACSFPAGQSRCPHPRPRQMGKEGATLSLPLGNGQNWRMGSPGL